MSGAMAEKGFESEDPLEMVAVAFPTAQDHSEEMARTFAEEFLLLGFTAGRVLRLFQNPGYAGAHMIYRQRGEEWVRQIIAAALNSGQEAG